MFLFVNRKFEIKYVCMYVCMYVGETGLVVTRVGCHTANIVFVGWRYPVGIYT